MAGIRISEGHVTVVRKVAHIVSVCHGLQVVISLQLPYAKINVCTPSESLDNNCCRLNLGLPNLV